MSVFGRLGRVLADVFKSYSQSGKRTTYSAARPAVLDPWTRGISDVTKLPTLPYFGYKFIYELYLYSDVLRLTIRSLVQETVRKGLAIRARFAVKCLTCGAEFDVKVSRCDYCKSDNLREPSLVEYRYLESFINDVNFNDQTLVEVLSDLLIDLNLYDNAFLAVVKDYHFNDNGEVVGAQVKEVIRVSPELVGLIMDSNGMYGRSDDGQVVMICLQHREKYHLVKETEVEQARCPICGLRMYPAYFSLRKGTFASQHAYVYFTNGEILHIKKFTHGIGYGMSPVYSIWMKLITLMKQDYFILTAYSLERPPKALLVLKGNIESLEKSFQRLMEEARNNPHMIYPLIVEPTPGESGGRVVEYVDLSYSPKDIDFIAYREEVRRTIGAVWGVMPIFSGDVGSGVGLANEGLQIVVTNRAVEREQHLVNTKILDWLRRQLGVSDWDIFLVPNEGRDIVARIQRERMRIDNALSMMQMGYKPLAFKTEDGIDFDYVRMDTEEPIPSLGAGGAIIKPPISQKKIQRYEGEPEHGRPRTDEQRFEGEELGRRDKTPSTFIVGEGGELIPEGDSEKSVEKARRKADVPEEYRRYISPEEVHKLPPGTRIHRGPFGGLFIDVREVHRGVLSRLGEESKRPKEEHLKPGADALTTQVSGRHADVKLRFGEEGGIEEISVVGVSEEIRRDLFDIITRQLYIEGKRRRNQSLTSASRLYAGLKGLYALRGSLDAFDFRPESRLHDRLQESFGFNINRQLWEQVMGSDEPLMLALMVTDKEQEFVRLTGRMSLLRRVYNSVGLKVYVSSEASKEVAQQAEDSFLRLSQLFEFKYPIPFFIYPTRPLRLGYAGSYAAGMRIDLDADSVRRPEVRQVNIGGEISSVKIRFGEVSIMHEYAHYIYHAVSDYMSSLRQELEKVRNVREAFQGDEEELGALVEDVVGKWVSDFLLSEDRELYERLAAEARKRGISSSELDEYIRSHVSTNWRRAFASSSQGREFIGLVDKYVSQLRDFVSGRDLSVEQVLRLVKAFTDFERAVRDDDGVTNYSRSFFATKKNATESWASFAELLLFVCAGLKARKMKLTKSAVIKAGEDTAVGERVGSWRTVPKSQRESVTRAWRAFVEIYDLLGVVKWDEQE